MPMHTPTPWSAHHRIFILKKLHDVGRKRNGGGQGRNQTGGDGDRFLSVCMYASLKNVKQK